MAKSWSKLVSGGVLPPSHADVRLSIDAQTAAFLKQGGKIQRIPTGVSGNVWTPPSRPKPTST